MAFTEFYCDPVNGSNLNAGSANAAAVYTGVGDSDGTSIFTPSDGSTPASTVSVGMFASIYVTAGATVAVFVGRVTVVAAGVNGAITVSTTAKSGTIPTNSAGAHTITCKVGGYWKGPNGAVSFPIGFITNTLTDVAGDFQRVNGIGTSNITVAMTHGNAGATIFQGMTSTPGDGGKWTIDGGISGTSYILLTVSAQDIDLVDMVFQNNGASGSSVGVSITGGSCTVSRCVVNSVRNSGFSASASNSGCIFTECEAYGCNQNNNGGVGAFTGGGTCIPTYVRCYSHNNTTANASGFAGNSGIYIDCIADTNGAQGFVFSGTHATILMNGCDAYNNTSDGIRFSGGLASTCYVENCNLVKNGGYGINGSGAGPYHGFITNCGFGSGTQANTSGTTNGLSTVQISGSITYASGVTPWNAPTTGDFSIVLVAAEYTGRGNFTETGNSKTGTVGHPDVGAAQHTAPSPAAPLSRVFTGM